MLRSNLQTTFSPYQPQVHGEVKKCKEREIFLNATETKVQNVKLCALRPTSDWTLTHHESDIYLILQPSVSMTLSSVSRHLWSYVHVSNSTAFVDLMKLTGHQQLRLKQHTHCQNAHLFEHLKVTNSAICISQCDATGAGLGWPWRVMGLKL